MSRRTAQASKAVREAWEKERQLVLAGKGTRDWTPEQQQTIIEKAKAYDEDKKAFEGHHMKSVEAYPEYQGDPGNIEFLTKAEHLDAHGGCFQNPTNGYYDPKTKLTRDFGESKYEPCKVIALSKPIRVPDREEKSGSKNADRGAVASPRSKPEKPSAGGLGEKVRGAVTAVKNFSAKHPVLTEMAKLAALETAAAVAEAAASAGKSPDLAESSYFPVSASSSAPGGDAGSFPSSDDDTDPIDPEERDKPSAERDYPDERSSPCEHQVSGYTRHRNGKTIHVAPYKRGGKTPH